MKKLIGMALGFGCLIGLGLSGCGGHDPAVEDLDPHGITQERGDRLVYVMPDTFPNVIAFCDGDTRVYVTNRDYQQSVVVPDSGECGDG